MLAPAPDPELEPEPEPEPEPERTPLERCNDERDELFCTYLWDGGTELVWAQGGDGALVQVEREIVPDITRILDESDPSVRTHRPAAPIPVPLPSLPAGNYR
jgi:hypothetical protein